MKQTTSLDKVIKKSEEMKKSKNNVVIVKREEKANSIFNSETIKKLLKSEEDIEKGRTRKATQVVEELRAKYGF